MFANFMKMALADKKAVPFRIPPGIKLVRVSLRTGLRAQGGEPDTVMEAFKPYEEPDDAYSIIGFTNESGGFFTGETRGRPATAQPEQRPRSLVGRSSPLPRDLQPAGASRRACPFTNRRWSLYRQTATNRFTRSQVDCRSLPCAPKLRSWLTPCVSRSPCCGGIFDWDTAGARLAELNKRAEDPNLWSDPGSPRRKSCASARRSSEP